VEFEKIKSLPSSVRNTIFLFSQNKGVGGGLKKNMSSNRPASPPLPPKKNKCDSQLRIDF